MLGSSRFTILAAATAATTLCLGLVPLAHAGVVFQADFTGQAQAISNNGSVPSVTGGTATGYVQSTSAGYASAAIGTNNPMASASGGYLQVTEQADTSSPVKNNGGAGVTITPTSGDGFDSWFSPTGSGSGGTNNTITGAFDFFYRGSLSSSTWAGQTLRVFDTNTNLRIFLDSTGANALQLGVMGGAQAIVNAGSLTPFTAGGLVHVAGTVTTNTTSGLVTATLYAVAGNTAITPGTTSIAGTGTSASAFTLTSSGLAGTAFDFGHTFYGFKSTVAQTEAFDQFRIYNGIPTTFSALPTSTPEPASLGLLAVGGLGLLLLGKRRHA